MNKFMLLILGLFITAGTVWAEVRTKAVDYADGDVLLEGYLAWDDAIQGPRPGVLLFHAWKGLGDYEKRRARELVMLGYVAFAVDMYGKGIRPQTTEEANKQSSIYKNDRTLARLRAKAGYDALVSSEYSDDQRIAAIGYCFGGMVALELARSGAPLKGVVTFHGALNTPTPKDAANIKAKVLVLHGADDPYVPAEETAAFQKEMREGGVDWQMIYYGGAVHSFTDPAAGNDPSQGIAYHPLADRRSWRAMKDFFEELFK